MDLVTFVKDGVPRLGAVRTRDGRQVVVDLNGVEPRLPSDMLAYLEPGDVIMTGTPGGVGHHRKPPLYLKPGDEVRVEIERLGTLVNPVVAECGPC